MMTADTYAVPCLGGKHLFGKNITVSVPGSKSITNRALLLATLAEGKSTLSGALFSDDSRHFLSCLESLGFSCEASEDDCKITVEGLGGKLPKKEASLYVGSAGTAARFLTALLGISQGTFHMDASEQMRRRPMAPLLASLQELGCQITYTGKEGFFPFTLQGRGFLRNTISVNIDSSSQFLSALLIASVLSQKDMTIRAEGSHGMAYISMTKKMMEQFGITVKVNADGSFLVPAGQQLQARFYNIEPDASAACYFYAMAAVLGISVVVKGVTEDSLQGDTAFLNVLEQMGCKKAMTPTGLRLTGPADGRLCGVTVDMSAFSDQAITLAAIAPFADSPVTITGIGHIRGQESNRMAAICENLSALGIRAEESENSISIFPNPSGNGSKKAAPATQAARIHTYDDHRLAMGFALTGLRIPGIVIENPGCCGKTFENYFEVLESAIHSLL